MTIPYESVKKKWEKDPKFLKEYELLKPEFDLAETLIRARLQSHLSQKEVAERMKTSQSTIARLESGQHNISLNTIRRYVQAIGRSIRIDISPV